MDIREYLASNRLIFDGGFGTYYSQKTKEKTEACELANLYRPEVVEDIHREYIEAGADAIKTNTFGAYPELMGGDKKQEEVLRAGVRIAKKAAAQAARPVYVFGDFGPAPGDTEEQKAEAYIRAAEIFLDEGVTNFLFETESTEEGILPAVRAIREKCKDAFIIVSFGVLPDGYSPKGRHYRALLRGMYQSGAVDIIGLNCVSSAKQIRKLLEALPKELMPRISAMPNAGYPVVRGFRTFFDGNAPYFAETMRGIADLGVRILGGCCGTTPEYIRKTADLLKALPALPYSYDIPSGRPEAEVFPERKISERAASTNRLIRKLSAGDKVIAVELDSPRNADVTKFMDGAKRLRNAGVDTLTIADCPVAQARMDSTLLACKVKRDLDLDVIPHMNCRDRNVNASKALLLGAHAENIRNVLVITGDPIPTAERDEVKSVYQFNSRRMISYVHSLNEEVFSEDPFGIFAALNVNARNFSAEIDRAAQKMENGAEGFLTQPVLTKEAEENLKLARKTLSGAYLLGGLIPVISEKNGRFMNEEINGISVPEDMIKAYHGADRAEGEKLARKFTGEICRKILPYVDGLYLMTPFQRIGLMENIVRDIREMLESDGEAAKQEGDPLC